MSVENIATSNVNYKHIKCQLIKSERNKNQQSILHKSRNEFKTI